MVNQQSFCAQALVDMMNGKHALGPSVQRLTAGVADTYKGALYLATASRGQADTVYNSTGEVSGTNYVAGGATLTTATAPALQSPATAYWTPSASLVWTAVTLGTAFNCVLIWNYSNSPTAGIALSTHTFGNQTVTSGNFTLTMPINDGTSGLIRFTAAPPV